MFCFLNPIVLPLLVAKVLKFHPRVKDHGNAVLSPSGAGAYTRRRVIPRDAAGRVIPREELEEGEWESPGMYVMDTPWTRESLARGNVPFK